MNAAATTDLDRRLGAVRSRIAAVCRDAGRAPDAVTLIGVTKTHPAETCRAAVAAGIGDLGENRTDELVAKAAAVDGARWHFIGRLQSRKASDVLGLVGPDGARLDVLIHSVDRRSLVDRLQRLADRDGGRQSLLIQVNVGDDPRKGGCGLHEVADLVAYARAQSNLAVHGLMTIPPLPPEDADPAAAARPHFARLRDARDDVAARFPEVRELSMGMSADLDAAVAEGATMVRVGTALFGPRPTS